MRRNRGKQVVRRSAQSHCGSGVPPACLLCALPGERLPVLLWVSEGGVVDSIAGGAPELPICGGADALDISFHFLLAITNQFCNSYLD